MGWELDRMDRLECGCICEIWENDKMTYMATTEYSTRYKYRCKNCKQIDQKRKIVQEQNHKKAEEDYQEKMNIWENHKKEILSIEHKTLTLIPNRKDLLRFRDLLLIEKIKNRYNCSKERLEHFNYELSYYHGDTIVLQKPTQFT